MSFLTGSVLIKIQAVEPHAYEDFSRPMLKQTVRDVSFCLGTFGQHLRMT